jgi:hypothetical protein
LHLILEDWLFAVQCSAATNATEADARQLVRACYFAPLGERSFGANRGTDYNAGIADKAAYRPDPLAD